MSWETLTDTLEAQRQRRNKWARRFLEMADGVALWSKDEDKKVGAVLVDGRRRVVGVGYNGFPDTVFDDPELLAGPGEGKAPFMVHAEMNAILNCPVSTQGLSLFVTHHPCTKGDTNCAKLVVQAGIREVWTWEPDPSFVERWGSWPDAFQNVCPLNFLQRGATPRAG